MPAVNHEGLRLATEDLWLTKSDASRFFIRQGRDGAFPVEERLMAAVREGRVRIRTCGRRTVYNIWDCIMQCNVL